MAWSRAVCCCSVLLSIGPARALVQEPRDPSDGGPVPQFRSCRAWPELKCGPGRLIDSPRGNVDPFEGVKGVVAPHEMNAPALALRGQDKILISSPLVPISMQPGGAYGRNAASQAAYLGLLVPRIYAEARPSLVVFDLGCADAINTIPLMEGLAKTTRNYTMVFVDLPANDWSTVRKTVRGHVKVYPMGEAGAQGTGASPDIFRGGLPVEYSAKGLLLARSFYQRLAAPASVDVAFSATSLQYLSTDGVTNKTDHAAADWLRFLRHRAIELRPGGALHITALHTQLQGQNLGPIWDLVKRVLRESVNMGLLSHEKRANWVWPGYSRTTEEFYAPFRKREVPELVLNSFEIVYMESPYWGMAGGDVNKFVELYVPSVMAWISPYMLDTLPKEVVELLEVKLYSEVMMNSDVWRHDFDQAVMTIHKMR